MTQIFRQFVYCNEQSYYNYPLQINNEETPIIMNSYVDGSIFVGGEGNNKDKKLAFTKVGIQAPPGTKFYINNPGFTNPAIIGTSGNITLDFADGGEILDLHFDQKSMEIIKDNPNYILIIDTISNEGGV